MQPPCYCFTFYIKKNYFIKSCKFVKAILPDVISVL